MRQRILLMVGDQAVALVIRAQLEENGHEVLLAAGSEIAMSLLRLEVPDLVLVDLEADSASRRGVKRPASNAVRLAALPMIALDQIGQVPETRPKEAGLTDRFRGIGDLRTHLAAGLHQVQKQLAESRRIHVGRLMVDLDARLATVDGRQLQLTPTEFCILRSLAQWPGHAFSRAELMGEGRGCSYAVAKRTVDSHVKNLRRKLERAGGRSDLVETVFGIGYRLSAGPEPPTTGAAGVR